MFSDINIIACQYSIELYCINCVIMYYNNVIFNFIYNFYVGIFLTVFMGLLLLASHHCHDIFICCRPFC